MKKKTIVYLRFVIIVFILILIPYIQNAGAGPTMSGMSFFMGFYKINDFPAMYLYIISMGMLEGVLITLFLQSLLKNIQEKEPTQFDLN